MPTEQTHILTINGGESSIKFAFFKTLDIASGLVARGSITRIGLPHAKLTVTTGDQEKTSDIEAHSYQQAVAVLDDVIGALEHTYPIVAVGHRLVHGGQKHRAPERITDDLLHDLEHWVPLAPGHMPGNILLVKKMRALLPNVLHIACFDTLFHADLPDIARTIPIARNVAGSVIQKYGFHGISYASVLSQLTKLDVTRAKGRVIIAHIGSGVSLTALQNGKPIDTTMSMTPASGVPMSTRSGDLDPGIFWYLSRQTGMTPAQWNELVNERSGLVGISGTSGDMQDLLAGEQHNMQAALAINIFCYSMKKQIGAFAAALGGVETLVFTGGIGERSARIRSRVCDGLSFLGVIINEQKNIKEERIISRKDSPVVIYVLPSDEEQMIAIFVSELL